MGWLPTTKAIDGKQDITVPCMVYSKCDCGMQTIGFECPPYPHPALDEVVKKLRAFYEPLLEASLTGKEFQGSRFYCGGCSKEYGCKGHKKKRDDKTI